ncbi:hypothetical protein B296_00041772 [Ensete ventricosum]|uniref:Uncharacterized protein n=1 Tax=Ensete ventricosum TaxID=4639 RepID=A0A426YDV4_ENSVE|nr:hypothetical protein B296_00041772 [Ensete ventricosum]
MIRNGSEPTLELYPHRDSLGMLKPIVPLYCTSLEVDGSDVYHGSPWCPEIMKVVFRARKPSRQISIFPSGKVHPHVSSYVEGDDGNCHCVACFDTLTIIRCDTQSTTVSPRLPISICWITWNERKKIRELSGDGELLQDFGKTVRCGLDVYF